MAVLFDTHAHYNDEQFTASCEQEAVLREVFSSSVRAVMNAGTNLKTSFESIALAEKWEGMYAAVGMHPEDCRDERDFDGFLSAITPLLSHPKVRAIGEIGLDYHWTPFDREHQLKWFDLQMTLAEKTGMPVIIHDREAHGDTVDMIRAHPDVSGILHSYSGSAETVKELVRRGWYISFSGVVTFKNASKVLDAVRAVPMDRILVETDCPYLSPVPFRGKRNCSLYVEYTARACAEARGEEYEEFCERTTRNACAVYRLPMIADS